MIVLVGGWPGPPSWHAGTAAPALDLRTRRYTRAVASVTRSAAAAAVPAQVHSDLPEHFDAVVVGSGFGGSVTAYRLAEAGLRVCLLERGRRYPPGSFPRTPHLMRHNFWAPRRGMRGLFNLRVFHGLDALVSAGLGGGSLIYANVLLRKDERWFVRENLEDGGWEHWPVTRADLDPHYDRVEAMLKPQTYPFDHPPYDRTSKTIAFKAAADEMGLDWMLPPLGVTFANPGEPPVPGEPIREERPNLHGRTRYTCLLTGECDIGCNFGSKNTLDYNYLTEADRLGAELRTGCDVMAMEPRPGGGYMVHYIDYETQAERLERSGGFLPLSAMHRITADRLVLAAGTLGSTLLLLRNRSAFPRLSNQIGSRFCGNGDLLTFAVRCSTEAGGKRVPRLIDPSYGPVITSAVRVADEVDGGRGRGFYMEDAGFPLLVDWLLQAVDTPRALWHARRATMRVVADRLRGRTNTNFGPLFSAMLGDATLSSGILPMLSMGRDIPDGRIVLRGSDLQIDWRKGRSGEYFDRVRATAREFAQALGGTFVDNPIWLFGRVITVHPLGGCPMGRDLSEGVVDVHGEVFNYPGLYVADGAVMPGPVGANPSLTIAALADSFADHIVGCARRGT